MEPESLVKLVASGNTTNVEEEWMKLAESETISPKKLASYSSVLAKLAKTGKTPTAETLAWAAIEAVAARLTPRDALMVARPFLLAVGNADDLRAQVADLYRQAYDDVEGLDALLEEAGIAGGRPVRRAIRTLDVCLAASEGDFLASRDDEKAARIDEIDCSDWTYTIHNGRRTEDIGAVYLADRYYLAEAHSFHVLCAFDPGSVADRLAKDPASVIVDICRSGSGEIDDHTLEAMLVPRFIDPDDWKKWWTRARSAIRKEPHIELEGRSPYFMRYVRVPDAPEDAFLADFAKKHGVQEQLKLLEKYVRDCKASGNEPAEQALRKACDAFVTRTKNAAKEPEPNRAFLWMAVRRALEVSGLEDEESLQHAKQLFADATDVPALFAAIDIDALKNLAVTTLVEARPSDWSDQLTKLLPTLPLSVCDRSASLLIDNGASLEDFAPIVQDILGDSVKHYEALLWLWDGPTRAQQVTELPLLTFLTRVLKMLDDCRRDDELPKEVAKRIAARSRSVLSARRYERYFACLEGMEPAMGNALRTQIIRLDNLGRAVRDDLARHLNRKFPVKSATAQIPPWELEDVLYVTQEAMEKKQAEIDHHVNVKMRENAIAIGAAAERGDLSENSEYKFALEERDLLQARLAQMQSEMTIARVITKEDVITDCASVGTRLALRRVDGADEVSIMFVSPWDADPEKHQYNYKAPLGQRILGKKPGDIIELELAELNGEFEIVGLANGLDDA